MSDDIEYLEKVEKLLKKKYGKITKSGDELIANPPKIISLSPSFDLSLNGGISEGTLNIMSGKPKTGKSTSILSFCAAFQRPENGSRFIYYLDVERRMKVMNLIGIQGLDTNEKHFKLIQSSTDKILLAEDFCEIIRDITNTHPNSVIVVDSASAMCSEKEFTGDIKSSTRNEGPKLLAGLCRTISNTMGVNNVTVFVIQHMIANTSGYGSPFMEDGGNKIQFAMETKIRVKKSEGWTEGSGDNEKTVGLKITWTIVNSGLGVPPGEEIVSWVRFGKGIDELKEYIELAIQAGIIDKPEKGSWITFKDKKIQGEAKLYQFFEENPEVKEDLIKSVKEVMA